MLKLENITYQPQTGSKIILDDLNLTVNKNEIILICGESGSGKTSLLEILGGLLQPQIGKIYWKNSLTSSRELRWLSGIVFQFPERFFIGTTIGRELKIGHKVLRENKITSILNKVGLSEVSLTMAPEKLSGGQQRRLAVAVQLLRKPEILLLDEPTAGLDWSMRSDVISLIKELKSTKTLIVVTHEPSLFCELPTKIFKLKKGKLIKF